MCSWWGRGERSWPLVRKSWCYLTAAEICQVHWGVFGFEFQVLFGLSYPVQEVLLVFFQRCDYKHWLWRRRIKLSRRPLTGGRYFCTIFVFVFFFFFLVKCTIFVNKYEDSILWLLHNTTIQVVCSSNHNLFIILNNCKNILCF